jgi:uncharacterized repeat protein (TIGR01451 family)
MYTDAHRCNVCHWLVPLSDRGDPMKRRAKAGSLAGVSLLVLAACEPSPWRHDQGAVDANGAAISVTDVAISPDGTHLAFVTAADLGPIDTNDTLDVYLQDISTGEITLVSANDDGTDGRPHASTSPEFSDDGNRIAFTSGPDTASGDPDVRNVYVRDLTTETTVRASRSGDSGFGFPWTELGAWHMSPDGTRVVSTVTEYGPDFSWEREWNVRDIETGEDTQLGVYQSAFTSGDFVGATSPDGTRTAYVNLSTECGAETCETSREIRVRDIITDEVTVIEHPERYDGNTFEATFAEDSSTVAFADSAGDVVMYDFTTGETETAPVGLPDRGFVPSRYVLAILPDGLLLASWDPSSGSSDVYHHSLTTDSTELILTLPGNLGVPTRIQTVEVSASTVVMATLADDLGPRDTNNAPDVYTYDIETGVTTLVSANADGNNSGNARSWNPSISDDGRHIAFLSDADNLGPDGSPNNSYPGSTSSYVTTLHTADIGVTAAAPEAVAPSGTITYEVEVTNEGPDPAENLRVGVLLPEDGVHFLEATATHGECQGPSPAEPRLVVCAFGDTDAGPVATVEVEADISADVGMSLETMVMVDTSTHDPDRSDNLVILTSSVT